MLIPGIGTPSLWLDEAATWRAVTMSFTRLLRFLSDGDAVIGAFYFAENLWVRFAGDSEAALRLPSALAMAATAGMTSLLAERWSGPRFGLLAGLLFIAMPSVTRFGQEARPYALVCFLAVLSTLLLLQAMERGDRRWRIAYAGALAALGLVQVTAVVLLGAHAVLAFRRRAARQMVPYVAAALVPVAIMALIGWTQRDQISWIEPTTLERVIPALASIVGGIVALAFVVGIISASAHLERLREPIVSALVPVALLFLVGLITPVFVGRYALYVLPFVAIGLAVAVAPLGTTRSLLVVGALVLLTLPDQASLRGPAGHGIAARGAVEWMAERCRAGDAYAAVDTALLPVEYYVAHTPACHPDPVGLHGASGYARLFVFRPRGFPGTAPAPDGFTFVEGVALTGVNVSLYQAR